MKCRGRSRALLRVPVRRHLGALLCLLIAVAPAAAEDETKQPAKPPTPEQAADAVLTAVRAGDEAALKELAARDRPDPWLVADELCFRSEHDAAAAFAKAASRTAVEKLPAYVASRRGKEPQPATRTEAQAVGTDVLLGVNASETGLLEGLEKRSRWRAVHLACHGLVDVEQPTRSALALTPAGEEDGFLTSRDLLRANVAADLVALSACETGTGKVYRAEGILGLTRAFMYAGASRVLCSLWKVDDQATRALMVEFYRLWNPSG